MELIDRLTRRLEVVASCWEWQGAIDPDGYGRIKVAGVSRGVHRVAYEELVGPIPDGLTIDHLCRNRRCANPEHLEAVPKRVNTLRGFGIAARKARQSECPNGHPYDAVHGNGPGRLARTCRRCTAAKQRRYQARLRAA